MNEEFKDEKPQVPPRAEPDVVALIKRMQQQLAFLEKKIDILISQSQVAPSRERHFSKPYQSFGRSHGQERGPSQGRSFEKRHGEENRGFRHKKKPPFYFGRKERG